MGKGNGSGAGANETLWTILWLVILVFVAFWVAGFCAGFYILLQPFSVCLEALNVSSYFWQLSTPFSI